MTNQKNKTTTKIKQTTTKTTTNPKEIHTKQNKTKDKKETHPIF